MSADTSRGAAATLWSAGRVALGAAVALALGAALAGCSQAAALAPVGGNRVSEARFATIDVLLEKGIAVQEAPVCENGAGTVITCSGTTAGGGSIEAESSTEANASLVVRVGGEEIYSGGLFDVLEKAARG